MARDKTNRATCPDCFQPITPEAQRCGCEVYPKKTSTLAASEKVRRVIAELQTENRISDIICDTISRVMRCESREQLDAILDLLAKQIAPLVRCEHAR
jgi:hypothetical protein